jgi:hypothetical protein
MDEQLSEQAHKEVLVIFQDRVANIRDLKRYEWQAAYYVIALISALVAIAHWSGSSLGFRFLLGIGCGITAWLWWVIESSLQDGLARQRDGVEKIYGLLSQHARDARPTIPADRSTLSRTLFLIVVVFTIGAAVAVLAG